MEFFQFCLEIINREAQKFNVAFDAAGLKKLTITSANNANYEVVHKRNHFLYRCATVKLHFANVCFKKFLLEQKVVENLLSKWSNMDDLTFCSLSSGPAMDYISLIHSFHESGMNPPLFKNIKVVTKYGAWKNTINIMHDIIREGYLKSLPIVATGKIKIVQGDPFDDFAKAKSTVGSSDVIVMMQKLNLQNGAYDKKKKSKSIKAFLDALKPGAVLFCIDTKESIKEITLLLDSLSGRFLLKSMPVNTQIDFVCPDVIYEHVGCLPVLATNGTFCVWEKSSESLKCKLSSKESNTVSYVNYLNSSSSPSTSSQITHDCFKRENEAIHLSSTCPELATACTQTEPDGILQETEAKKVMELTKRVENLTADLTKILENNDLVPNDSNCDHYSSVISCSRFSGGTQSCEACSSQYNSLSHCCCSCNHTKIKATSNEFETSSFCNPPVNLNLATSTESNLSSAQLIIPLTNLSSDVVSQIISLLSQSKQT